MSEAEESFKIGTKLGILQSEINSLNKELDEFKSNSVYDIREIKKKLDQQSIEIAVIMGIAAFAGYTTGVLLPIFRP